MNDMQIAEALRESQVAARSAASSPSTGKAIWWLGISASYQRHARRLSTPTHRKGE